jgi:hypothetical protein
MLAEFSFKQSIKEFYKALRNFNEAERSNSENYLNMGVMDLMCAWLYSEYIQPNGWSLKSLNKQLEPLKGECDIRIDPKLTVKENIDNITSGMNTVINNIKDLAVQYYGRWYDEETLYEWLDRVVGYGSKASMDETFDEFIINCAKEKAGLFVHRAPFVAQMDRLKEYTYMVGDDLSYMDIATKYCSDSIMTDPTYTLPFSLRYLHAGAEICRALAYMEKFSPCKTAYEAETYSAYLMRAALWLGGYDPVSYKFEELQKQCGDHNLVAVWIDKSEPFQTNLIRIADTYSRMLVDVSGYLEDIFGVADMDETYTQYFLRIKSMFYDKL